jgi:hypothetical protein
MTPYSPAQAFYDDFEDDLLDDEIFIDDSPYNDNYEEDDAPFLEEDWEWLS